MNKVDTEIVCAFINGDDQAFTELYNQYSKQVYIFALQHCRQSEIAQEIVQNAFMSVYKARNSLRQPDSFYSWLLQIAYNETRKIMKKENIEAFSTQYIEELQFAPSPQNGVENQAYTNEILHVISQSINRMKPEFKEVAILRYYYDLTNKEIVDILHIPLGTVKSRGNRATRIIKEDLSMKGMTPDTIMSYNYLLPMILTKVSLPPGLATISIPPTSFSKGLLSTLRSSQHIYKILGSIGIVSMTSIFLLNLRLDTKSSVAILHKPMELEIIEATCQITDIIYPTEYTKNAITLEVRTSNDDYDYILVNGIQSLMINDNGTYMVDLWKDDQILDQREIEITNIDTTIPQVVSITNNGDMYYIHIEDYESGLNYSSLAYYYNDQLSNDYTFDQATNTIIFTFKSMSTNIFYIEDNAGNWRRIQIYSDLL